jgi:general secretion pathway protein K
VLGIIAVMSAIAIGIVFDTQKSLRYRLERQEILKARNLAELGLKAGWMLLQYDYEEDSRYSQPADYFLTIDPSQGIEALKEIANRRELWSLFREGSQGLALLFGLPVNILPIQGEGSIELTIQDLTGRYNLYRLYRPQGITDSDPEYRGALHGLELLLEDLSGADPRTILDSLLDWLDADSEPLSHGAESFYYQGLRPPYLSRNGVIPFPEEIRLIKGVDAEIYARLSTVVTIYPYDLPGFGDYKINVNTAPLQALPFLDEGIDFTLAEAIVQERESRPFTNPNQIIKFLQDRGRNDVAGRILGLIGVRSRAFLVRAIGYTEGTRAILEAVLDRDPSTGNIRIISYRLKMV